jgi:two-component system, OmpR family, response regulator ChvI
MKAVVTLEADAPVPLASVSEEPDDALRVLLIEDSAIDGGFLTDKLSKQGIVVRTVASLADAHETVGDADVIVLHCKRVNDSSIELLGKLRALDIPAVLVTNEAAPAHECLALDQGAIDSSLRHGAPMFWPGASKAWSKLSRVRIARGPADPGSAELLLRPDTGRAYWKGVDVGLTLGEYKIVHLLASNAARYVTYRAIYDRLGSPGNCGDRGTF